MWRKLFNDTNDINEKSILGFISFGIMVVVAIIDIVCGLLTIDFKVTEFVYQSFVIVTLGCFGIAEAGKIFQPSNDDRPYYRRRRRRKKEETDQW